jgi:chromosome segregation ATPase
MHRGLQDRDRYTNSMVTYDSAIVSLENQKAQNDNELKRYKYALRDSKNPKEKLQIENEIAKLETRETNIGETIDNYQAKYDQFEKNLEAIPDYGNNTFFGAIGNLFKK